MIPLELFYSLRALKRLIDSGSLLESTLFPWLTARQNVALGVEQVYPHATRAERRDVVSDYLARVGLGDAVGTSLTAVTLTVIR
ncbi:hypothetical protein WCLP8_40006 [uncultured Gammaproteobacteria bacterium]